MKVRNNSSLKADDVRHKHFGGDMSVASESSALRELLKHNKNKGQ